MSSEDISLIATQPIIREFVYSIIQTIKANNIVYEEKDVIHADLVPRMSEHVMQASLMEKVTPRPVVAPVAVAPPVVPKRRQMPPRRMVPQRMAPPIMRPPQRPPAQQISAPSAPEGTQLSQDYGKITPLLNDPSVSTIECPGEGKPLTIIRAGQKQGTKISLNAKEIKEVLQKVSDAVHIPLLEGVFRAAVDNFSINAVISEMIGSRFVIKKQTAYTLLER